ncbi:MAG: hypothetical protein ABIT01_16125 [Thermoanaerobaculia bacterium]
MRGLTLSFMFAVSLVGTATALAESPKDFERNLTRSGKRDAKVVRIDLENRRAYIPEGTVLPAGLQIRASREGAVQDDNIEKAQARLIELKKTQPFVIEYASTDSFSGNEANRTKGAPFSKITSLAEYCYNSSQLEVRDVNNNLIFESIYCVDPFGVTEGNYATWRHGAIMYNWGHDSAYAYVTSGNGNFECTNSGGYLGGAQCSATHYSLLHSYPVSTVDTGGSVSDFFPFDVENYLVTFDVHYD